MTAPQSAVCGLQRMAAGIAKYTQSKRSRVVVLALLVAFSCSGKAAGASPSDPQVRELVEKGLAYLEQKSDARLGGKALIGLAFLKASNVGLAPPNHQRIQEAHQACRQMADHVQLNEQYIYSKGLAVIFLAEARGDRELMRRYADMLLDHQKQHGGFGYRNYRSGDTSQTQYAALAFWELLNHGSRPKAESVRDCINWLLRTQDPSGVWGYQGEDPGSFELIEQTDEPGPSMSAAGMGSVLILGNLLGLLLPPNETQVVAAELPKALKPVDVGEKRRGPSLAPGDVDPQRIKYAVDLGKKWFDANFTTEGLGYPCYYLYSVERYKSFEEYLSGVQIDEPEWYDKGFEFLKEKQRPDGSWNGASGSPCATAFAILFLLRSTQQSIKSTLGEGTLVGGRGLPRDLSRVKLRGGSLVVDSPPTEVNKLLDMLKEGKSGDDLLYDFSSISLDNLTIEDARRLEQMVRDGKPAARLLAVRGLGKLRRLDYVPILIYALTDPDRRVVRAARDALRSISRKIDGFGLSDNFEESERDQVVEQWRQWYMNIHPDADLTR